MKKLQIVTILILSSLLSKGQPDKSILDGYKYIFIPTLKYKDDKIDIYNISGQIRIFFYEKGLLVYTEDSKTVNEALENPCLRLSCRINHAPLNSNTMEVSITVENCKKEVIYQGKGSASGNIRNEVARKATDKALGILHKINYKYTSTLTPIYEYPKVDTVSESEETLRQYFSQSELDPIEGIYNALKDDQNGMPFYKLGIKKIGNKFIAIVIESELKIWKPGEIKAYFEQSSISGLYSAKWLMLSKTIYETFATMDNEALLSIELEDLKTGKKRQAKFIKMYPQSKSNASKVDNSVSSGSGFFLTSDGIVATNAHVVENAKKIEISISNDMGTFNYKVKILLLDSKNDVALLKVEDVKFKHLASIPYGISEKADIGENIFTIGYPLNDIMGTNFKVSNGIISAKTGIADDIRFYQISAPLQPGNSGGPLFDQKGNVIGITSTKLNAKAIGTEVENVNYAIKSAYLINLYNMLTSPPTLKVTSSLANKDLKEQIKIFKNYVCLIRVFPAD